MGEKLDFLLLMEDYQQAYTQAIKGDLKFASLPYEECAQELFSKSIYYGDAYIHAFNSEGYSVKQVIPFCQPLQYKWAAENGVWVPPSWATKRPFNSYWYRRLKGNPINWALEQIITEQIKRTRPKNIWVFSGVPFSKQTITSWRPFTENIILWWACPIALGFPYAEFDLILSGIPALSKYFQLRGVNAAHMPHAFDNRILKRFSNDSDRHPKAAFAGSLSEEHIERILLLETLSRNVGLDFYGPDTSFLSENSSLRKNYLGSVWGKDLYSIYASYLLIIHKNINVAGKSTSAKRLFEATGMGACVITEASENERELFKPDEEIVTYSSIEDCVEKVKYLINNPQIANEIGKNGQRRTLAEHSYKHRVKELMQHISQI